MNLDRVQHLLPDFNGVRRLVNVDRTRQLVSFDRVQHLLPGFVRTPRRAGISVALIAGLAAGPLAGTAAAASASPGSAPATPAISRVLGGGAAAPSAAPTAVPTAAQLEPEGAPSPDTQSFLDLDSAQIANAHTIVATAQAMKLPLRAAVIAVATSMQETKLINYGDLGDVNDHDSLGLFQQRPSSGWGTPDQLTDPTYAATAFLRALVQVPGWDTMPLTDAAQTVQVSAFGDRYAQWEQQAADLVLSSYHAGPYANAG